MLTLVQFLSQSINIKYSLFYQFVKRSKHWSIPNRIPEALLYRLYIVSRRFSYSPTVEIMSESITDLRRKRGNVRSSITRIRTRLRTLQEKEDKSDISNHARQMSQRLDTLSSKFKEIHYSIVAQLESEDELTREQANLDETDDEVAQLLVEIEILAQPPSISPDGDKERDGRILSRRLTRIERKLDNIGSTIEDEEGEIDIYLVQQYEADMIDYKRELSEIHKETLTLGLEDTDEICVKECSLEDNLSRLSIKLRRLSNPIKNDVKASDGVKLPKLDVPSFDGNILSWRTFWEQFEISIHNRPSLSGAEKLVYLRQALKDGSAKNVIEGLSRSGDCYEEAIECLKGRFNRPRLIHQAHVKMILEAPPLKDGTGKEIRRLHDIAQQHIRALRAMELEPSGEFMTSLLELKLDPSTMFEWQRHSQDSNDVPHFQELLKFLNLRAQATEASHSESNRKSPRGDHNKSNKSVSKSVPSYVTTTSPNNNCFMCKKDKHPLYVCPAFLSLSQQNRMSVAKANKLCTNCLKPGHFVKQCKSAFRCKTCQKPHHSLLHIEVREDSEHGDLSNSVDTHTSHTATGIESGMLLTTCKLMIEAPSGMMIEARGLLDSASSASFVSERIVQALKLPRSTCNAKFSGIAGMAHSANTQSLATFNIAPSHNVDNKINVTAIVLPRITCNLPVSRIPFDPSWKHLLTLPLADPTFGIPGRIDILLGVDIFSSTLLHGRQTGPPGAPVALETEFGWVLAGQTKTSQNIVTTHHVTVSSSSDELLRAFWEVENPNVRNNVFSPEEKVALQHYENTHHQSESGMFVISLPRRNNTKPIGESCSKAVRRYLSLERSLLNSGRKEEFDAVMKEYFELDHAEVVPISDLNKAPEEVFYLPMHAVRKDASTTTQLRIVFDASAKSSTGVSLNDTLLVGPTVHPTLIDVLIRFRRYKIAMITDVSKMYRAVGLVDKDKDFHRFVWREKSGEPLIDYRMTRVTFGVSASAFVTTMSIKRNAIDNRNQYPLAHKAVCESFYVDDGLVGADSVDQAINLQKELQNLFYKGGFLLRKWNSSNSEVLEHIPRDLKASMSSHSLPDQHTYTKTLGIEWNSNMDHFRLTVSELPSINNLTKRALVSDIAKTFDILGWFSPAIITVKILLQRVWEEGIEWDQPVPEHIKETWTRWRSELKLLTTRHISRCYFPIDSSVASTEIHGFCDASERAYAAVVYYRTVDDKRNVHTAIVISKTKVAPIKRLTIPRLELCGAQLLANLLFYVKELFNINLDKVFAWTDSTVVLNWLVGNPRRFKTFVGNRVSDIVDHIPPDRWKHVGGLENPADCASRGLFPSELLHHDLWWTGPSWLLQEPEHWPNYTVKDSPMPEGTSEEERNVCLITFIQPSIPIVPLDRYSSFDKLNRLDDEIYS